MVNNLKIIKMDGNLAMANQFEGQDEGYTPFEMELLNQISELKKSNSKLNEIIGNSEAIYQEKCKAYEFEAMERRADIEDLERLLEERTISIDAIEKYEEIKKENNELKVANDILKKATPIELARGLSLWLLCNYYTPKEGESLCWINAKTGARHGNNEVCEIYINSF